jgi:hypothetical protein
MINSTVTEEQIEEVRKTLVLDANLAEKLELDAFWSRRTLKQVLTEILENHYQGKSFDPYPAGYSKAKTGRPKQ